MIPEQGGAEKWNPPNVVTKPRSMGRNKETLPLGPQVEKMIFYFGFAWT